MRKKITFAYSKHPVHSPTPGANQRFSLDQLYTLLTASVPPAVYNELPELARRSLAGDLAAKKLLNDLKRALPFFIPSGFCPIGHNDATLEYNGILQIDIDIKHPDGAIIALAILELIIKEKPAGVLLAGLSPSTFGVKILLHTDNQDKAKHRAAFEYVRAILSEGLQISAGSFDVLGASQPCYMFYQRPGTELYYNPDADAVHIPLTHTPPATKTPQVKRSAPGAILDPVTLEQIKQAADFLMQNRCNVATCYDEYLQVMMAAKHAFGPNGADIALAILDNCPTFTASTTRSQFAERWSKLTPERITGRTLLYIAGKFGFTGHKTAPQQTFDLLPGEYLTHAAKRHSIEFKAILGKYIIAPTGAGKTRLAAEISKQTPVVLIVPTTAQVDQIAQREGATPWHGNARNLPQNCRFIVSTLQSFPALLSRLQIAAWQVIFDEAHGFTTDSAAGYKLEELRYFLELRRVRNFTVTYLTGTDIYNYHPDFKDLERVIFTGQNGRKKALYIQRADNIAATVAQYARESVAAGRVPFILLNDKSGKLAALKTALDGYKIAIINADTKESPEFKQITKKGTIPPDVEIIISTTVIREGTDINDQRGFDFLIIGQHHSTTIEQISARARTSPDISVYLFKKKESEQTGEFFPDKYAKVCEGHAQRFCNEHNTWTKYDSTETLYFELQLRKAMQQVCAYQPDNSTDWQVCYLSINNAVYKAETITQHKDDQAQIKALEQYGFEYCESITERVNDQHSADTAAAISAAVKETKQQRRDKYTADLEALETALFPAAEIERAKRGATMPDAYKHAQKLNNTFGLDVERAAELLRRENPKGSAKGFKLIVCRLAAELLRHDTQYMDSGRIMSLVLLQLDKLIQPGQRYTADELREKLRAALLLDKSLNVDKLLPPDDVQQANRKALEILRYFYTDTQRRPGADTGTRPRKRVFSLYINTILADVNGGHHTLKHRESIVKKHEQKLRAALVS